MDASKAADRVAMGINYAGIRTRDLAVEDCPKRVRVYVAGQVIADSRRVKLMHERGHVPVYYFPVEDIRTELLVPSEKRTHCPRKGDARYWSVRVGDRLVEDAVWNYAEPLEGCPDISGLAAFYWNKMDAWYEEDEEVFVHARDPYKRIDVLESSRHVVVQLDGITLAESRRPVLLFETGLPVRYYVPKPDVRWDHLEASDTSTRCPYKGVANRYWSAQVGGRTVTDVAWSYDHPTPEAAKIAGRVAFFNEKLDMYVDGEREERPVTPWSRS